MHAQARSAIVSRPEIAFIRPLALPLRNYETVIAFIFAWYASAIHSVLCELNRSTGHLATRALLRICQVRYRLPVGPRPALQPVSRSSAQTRKNSLALLTKPIDPLGTEAEEARALIHVIDLATPTSLRDRALISLMVYTFARVGAALAMRREDVFVQRSRLWVRLHEKGGKRHEVPCHHLLDEYLTAYLDATAPAIPETPLFRALSRTTKQLSERPLTQPDAYAMVGRRATAAGIATKIGNHTFRATGISTYLKNGGTLEKAAAMAGHGSTRTTQIYDHKREDITLTEWERVRL